MNGRCTGYGGKGVSMNSSGKTTFTLAEAAELLSCHRETLRRAIRDGELRAAKLGREFRISRPDLEAFWIACGGGDLFNKNISQPAQDVEEKDAAGRSLQKKRKDTPTEQQLSLLGRQGTPLSGKTD